MQDTKTLLFDLDGTLTDPAKGITKAVKYALNHFRIYPASLEELFPYIGPPLTESFQKFNGFTEKQAKEALGYYREYFSQTGIFENKPYEGVHSFLASLKKEGYRLMIATSKPEEFTHLILEKFDFTPLFDFVGGNTLGESRPTKKAVIAYIREQYPDINGTNTLMIGDRRFDMQGASVNGIPGIGVTFGYGSAEELISAGATCLAGNYEELTQHIHRLLP